VVVGWRAIKLSNLANRDFGLRHEIQAFLDNPFSFPEIIIKY
jgi:hypothetical protein